MSESKPLTAAERAMLREDLDDRTYPDRDILRLLAERDALAAQLAEARGIARRLAEIVRAFEAEATPATSGGELRRFDALHWPDPEEG